MNDTPAREHHITNVFKKHKVTLLSSLSLSLLLLLFISLLSDFLNEDLGVKGGSTAGKGKVEREREREEWGNEKGEGK